MMTAKEFEELESQIVEDLEAIIGDLGDDVDFRLSEIQPPTSIIHAAAVAAAQVLIAFERGYQMSGDDLPTAAQELLANHVVALNATPEQKA